MNVGAALCSYGRGTLALISEGVLFVLGAMGLVLAYCAHRRRHVGRLNSRSVVEVDATKLGV